VDEGLVFAGAVGTRYLGSGKSDIIVMSPGADGNSTCLKLAWGYADEFGIAAYAITTRRGRVSLSPSESEAKVFLPDGRLPCSFRVRKGRTTVHLGSGVYFWLSRSGRGKFTVH
jgi:hypothetical protein